MKEYSKKNSSKNIIYTSKILKASALIDDTRTFLSFLNKDIALEDNLAEIRQRNILGKSSRSRNNDIINILHQRYLFDTDVANTLSYFVNTGFPVRSLKPILFFFNARSDALLHDVVTKILWDATQRGKRDINAAEIRKAIDIWISEGKMESKWSDATIARVARHTLASLRDYGILEGASKKRISPIYLPNESFAFIAYFLYQNGVRGENLLNSEEWKLFLLPHTAVERFFIEADMEGLLSYHAAGQVIRIDFPFPDYTRYSDVIARK